MIANLQKHNYPLGQTIQTIGKEIGGVLSYNVFIWLNSAKISKEVFGYDGKILTVKQFFFILGGILLGVLFVLVCCVKEKCSEKNSKKLGE